MFSNMFSGILTGCFANFALFVLLDFVLAFSSTFYRNFQNQFRADGSRQCCYLMAPIKCYKLKSTILNREQKSGNNNSHSDSINGTDAFNLIDNFVFLVKFIFSILSVFVCLSRFGSGCNFNRTIDKQMCVCAAPALDQTTESGWFLCKQSMPRGPPMHGSWQWFFMWMPRRKKRSWLQPNLTNGMWFYSISFFFEIKFLRQFPKKKCNIKVRLTSTANKMVSVTCFQLIYKVNINGKFCARVFGVNGWKLCLWWKFVKCSHDLIKWMWESIGKLLPWPQTIGSTRRHRTHSTYWNETVEF